jgi:Protein of unknown function (DUF4244)
MATPETRRSERGMVTAEYAVGTIAACSIAGVCLYPVFTSPWMRELLLTALRTALESWW